MDAKRDGKCPRTGGCITVGCFELATVRVRLGRGSIDLCPLHWQERRTATTERLLVEKELPRPRCFKHGCPADAVSAMTHLDGRCLPVCEEHLEDLSWVTPSRRELTALGSRHE